MTTPTPRYLTPECRQGECGLCPGPGELRLTSQGPGERPLLTLQCEHSCHARGARMPRWLGTGSGPGAMIPAPKPPL
ncbi:hypothetical protein [Streptomyces sp. NPDC001889]